MKRLNGVYEENHIKELNMSQEEFDQFFDHTEHVLMYHQKSVLQHLKEGKSLRESILNVSANLVSPQNKQYFTYGGTKGEENLFQCTFPGDKNTLRLEIKKIEGLSGCLYDLN